MGMTGSTINATIKQKFIAGLFVSIPAIITILVITKFIAFVDSLVEPIYFTLLGYHTPGLGFLSAAGAGWSFSNVGSILLPPKSRKWRRKGIK